MRWITVGLRDQPGTSIVLFPPAASPGVTDEEKQTIAGMMAKGAYAIMLLATHTWMPPSSGSRPAAPGSSRSRPGNPMACAYGVRDCALRDPAGNLLRVQERAGTARPAVLPRAGRRAHPRPAGRCRGRLHPLPRGSHARLTVAE